MISSRKHGNKIDYTEMQRITYIIVAVEESELVVNGTGICKEKTETNDEELHILLLYKVCTHL
jgi:hypothetical protein